MAINLTQRSAGREGLAARSGMKGAIVWPAKPSRRVTMHSTRPDTAREGTYCSCKKGGIAYLAVAVQFIGRDRRTASFSGNLDGLGPDRLGREVLFGTREATVIKVASVTRIVDGHFFRTENTLVCSSPRTR
ncbi:hypothetical protein N7462_003072 [Penicillium macrosclerotiorum]|uniref:uncharacterized protein n=1 Tax=Penicillium macrosclerotiorum TaxID=303699 RepID=UPI002549BDF2|nr:uncharacterized protein N7462_003072 [Penicillium macrosclerotiorum]KAJ5688680.1 hypothetical protein N7462_003072 [Penicillium macrosclerotiorum]